MERRSRRGLTLLAILWAVAAGCATSNTLAQDLAWERWQKCSHIPTIQLQRITPDGQTWVNWMNGQLAMTQLGECLQKAAIG